MKKRKKDEVEMPSSPGWMTTYGDMMTLLLCFFVLLLSYSSVDIKKFSMAIYSLKGALSVFDKNVSVISQKSVGVSQIDEARRAEIRQSIVEMEQIVKELGYEQDISIEETEGGMLIRMGNRVLFDLGKADLKPEALPLLDVVGNTIGKNAGEVLVCGNTDNLPITTGKFPSNWELSTARALSVVKYLINVVQVSPDVFGAVGYSEYRPLVPNDSPENRQKNRRVEFLVTWK
jgi:chemotaxis protein MotB